MKPLVKPQKLNRDDKVATISLSWGGAGEIPHRYQQGKKQLEEQFGLKVVETKNALKPAKWLYENPEARANDLMEAFADPSIKAIFSNIGGEDSIRILPFLDLNVIRNNPKIFIGFSDTTVTHFSCMKAGLSSFYGTSVLVGFAENGGMHDYQIKDIERNLFSSDIIGNIELNNSGWTSERLEWGDVSLASKKRKLNKSDGWNFLQGKGKVQGRLIGGCVEVLEMLKGTDHWPALNEWDDTILFLETSEVMMSPTNFKWCMWNYAAQGIFHRIKGIILGRPYHNEFVKEYNSILVQIIKNELQLDIPIITQLDFGHTCPVFTIPYGIMAEIDCDKKSFSMLENAVI